MKNSLYIVVAGCGKLGSYLANQLSRQGNLLVIIDWNESTFENLSTDYSGFRVEGDASQVSVLKEAKMNRADWVIATTNDDNINLLVAQVALKIFNVPHVLARVFDPKREQVYTQLGIDTYCPTSVAAQMFLKTIANSRTGQGMNKS